MKGFFSKSQLQTKQITPMIARCGICGLYKHCKTPKMKPYGKGEKGILVIAEAPGRYEDEIGKPLVGKSGMVFETALAKLGINLSRDCIRTNACICRPVNNVTPDDEKIEACRPNVIKTIEKYKPKVIILLGSSACKSVLGYLWKDKTDTISQWAGLVMPNQQLNCWICPTYHPSYLQRMKDSTLDLLFKKHLQQAILKAEKGKPFKEIVDYKNQIEIYYEPRLILSAINGFASSNKLCAFDYEANCLKPEVKGSEIISCSISNGKRTIAFPWSEDVLKSSMVYFLKNKSIGKIASNLKFEDRWTRAKLGFPVKNWAWDTMLAAHVIDQRSGITGLKFQAFAALGVSDYESHIKPFLKSDGNKLNRIKEIDKNDLLIYNGLDALLEHKLAMKQMKILGVINKEK